MNAFSQDTQRPRESRRTEGRFSRHAFPGPAISLLFVAIVLAVVASPSEDTIAKPIEDDEPIEEIVEQVEPAEKILGILEAQAGTSDPAIPGLDGAPLPHGSPLFMLNYPAPGDLRSAHDSAEPSIGVNWETDRAFFKANTAMLRAEWDDTTVPPAATWADVTPPASNAITLDPIGHVDPITGRIFDVTLLGEFSDVRISDDDGATWLLAEPAYASPSFDHQTLGTGPYALGIENPVYENAVYYCAQPGVEFGDGTPEVGGGGGAQCSRSDDGGLTWGLPLASNTFQCGALHGTVFVGPDGTVYLPFGDCLDSAADAHRQGFTRSMDNGVTWERVTVPESCAAGSDLAGWTDDAGNLYAGWSHGNCLEPDDATPGSAAGPALARVLRTNGEWGPVTDLGAPFGVVNSVFPEVIAGDEGRAAVAFLGTSTSGDVSDALFPGEWHLYVSFTYDAGETWTTVDATPVDPVQRGCVWLFGGSNPCRNLLDFNDVKIDSTGRVVAAIADGCTLLDCVNRGGLPAESRDALGVIARQTGGPRLREASDPAEAQPVYAFARGNRLVVGSSGQVDAAAMGGSPPYTFRWDFDLDGAFDDATGQSPTFTANEIGIKTIRVQAKDAEGTLAEAEAQLRVKRPGLGRVVQEYTFDASTCDPQGWIPRAGFLVSTSAVAADQSEWHLTTDRPASEPCAWYHGQDLTKEYPDGSAVQLDSPTGEACFFLPKNALGANLVFDLAGASEADFDFLFPMLQLGSCIPDTPENKVSSAANFLTLAQFDGQVGDLFADPPVYETKVVNYDIAASFAHEQEGAFYQLRFRFVSDNFVNDTGFQIDNIRIHVDDEPPVVDAGPDASFPSTETFSRTIVASDPEDDPFTLSAEELPENATFDPETGEFFFDPADAQTGEHAVTFCATDGLGTGCDELVLTVLDEPAAPEDRVTGGGWLADGTGGKVNFSIHARGQDGEVKVNDKPADVKIRLDDITFHGAVTEPCGSVPESGNSAEIRGEGTFNGAAASFRVCVQDNADPGHSRVADTPDLFYLECVDGCAYTTGDRTPDDALDGGNLQVRRQGDPDDSAEPAPTTVILEPVLLTEEVVGHTLSFTVKVFDQNQDLMEGTPVALSRTLADGTEEVFEEFDLLHVGEAVYRAMAGSAESNTVEVSAIEP